MSRHRFVRNIDVREELVDDALSDGGEDELDTADYDRMMDGLEQVRATLGSEEETGVNDRDIKDTLYYYHFDVRRSIDWLLEEQGRKNAAMERKDPGEKPLPLLPEDNSNSAVQYVTMIGPSQVSGGSGRTNIPLIRLAQSQDEELYESSEPSILQRHRLSTITERTERTEDVGHRTPVRRDFTSLPQAGSSLSVTTDYGEIIEPRRLNPNDVLPSPTTSALQRLSFHESAPSASPTQSRTPSLMSPIRSPVPPLPQHEPITNITDSGIGLYPEHDAISHPQLMNDEAPTPVPARSEKKSKLSTLASSRSSVSASSRSSRSSASDLESVVTYPKLRPSSGSFLSLVEGVSSSTTGSSSMSSHVRHAIQTALDLEAVDRAAVAPEPDDVPGSPFSPASTIRPQRSVPARSHRTPSPTQTPRSTVAARPTATLSQVSPDDIAGPVTTVVRSSEAPGGLARPPSKLAALAQAKAQQGHWMPKPKKPPTEPLLPLHKPHTEYLTPIANGSSMTTAITTTYQTLGSLMSPAETIIPPSFPPSSFPVHLPANSSSRSEHAAAEPRQSKLAIKSRKALQKHEPEPPSQESRPSAESPLFSSKATRSCASPSAFASLLLDDDPLLPHEDNAHLSKSNNHKDDSKGARKHRGRGYRFQNPSDRHRNTTHGERGVPVPPLSPLSGFAFDIPSPDDLVSNARRGTSLAAPSVSSSQYPHSTPSLGSSSLRSYVKAAVR
ncbi:hypothetical protein BKA93DRAFT_92820 [Sparassis latifolia]